MEKIRFEVIAEHIVKPTIKPVIVETYLGGNEDLHFSLNEVFIMYIGSETGTLRRLSLSESHREALEAKGIQFDGDNKIKIGEIDYDV